MAVTALIVFAQGGETTVGEAMVGMLSDGEVTITNSDNTDVGSWSIELIGVPPDSGLATEVLDAAVSSTPSATFSPDTFGSYRVRISLTGTDGSTDVDIRVFTVPLGVRGYILPPYQGYPEPLPLTGAGAKPNELNFSGQAFGWMGDSSADHKLLHRLLQDLDEFVGLPTMVGAADGYTPALRVAELNEPIAVVPVGRRAYVLSSAYSDEADTTVFAHFTEYNPDSNKPLSDTEVSSSSVSLVAAAYDGSQYIWAAAKSGSTGAVRRFDVAAKTFSLTAAVASAAATGLVFGGGYLWYIDTSDLTRIDPAAPGTQVTASGLQGTPTPTAVYYDADGTNYGDGNARVWLADSALPGLQRLTTAGVGDLYSTLSNTAPVCVAVGGGYVWTAAVNTSSGYATLYRLNPDTGALSSSSTDINSLIDGAGGGEIFDVLYEPVTDAVYVLGIDGSNDAYLLKVNKNTLSVVSSVVLASSVPGLSGPPPRMSTYKGDIWVPLLSGDVLRVTTSTLAVNAALDPYASVSFTAPAASVTLPTGVSDAYKVAIANAAGTDLAFSDATLSPTVFNLIGRELQTTGKITATEVDLSSGAAPTAGAVNLVNTAKVVFAASSGYWSRSCDVSDRLLTISPSYYYLSESINYAGAKDRSRHRVVTAGTTSDTSIELELSDNYFGSVHLELVAEDQNDPTANNLLAAIRQQVTAASGTVTFGAVSNVVTPASAGSGSSWTYEFTNPSSNIIRLTLTGSGVLDVTWLVTVWIEYGSLT